jgi:pimeloyl-ACP methyl ester carboxylesterase
MSAAPDAAPRISAGGLGGSYRGGSGEPLLLIHGFSGTRGIWTPVLPTLERSHDVLAVNLTGHVGGPELAPGTRASVGALADAVEREMDAAGFQTAHVVGNSLGGWIALELAMRGRARSVIGLSPAGGWEAGTSSERRLRTLFTRSHRLSKMAVAHADALMRRPRLRRLMLSQVVAHGERIPAASAAQILRDAVACPIYFDLMDAILEDGPLARLDEVSCPALLAWGTRDRILPSPRYSARLREMLPAAEWLDLPGLGHVPTWDDPVLIARTIVDFAALAAARADTVLS